MLLTLLSETYCPSCGNKNLNLEMIDSKSQHTLYEFNDKPLQKNNETKKPVKFDFFLDFQ